MYVCFHACMFVCVYVCLYTGTSESMHHLSLALLIVLPIHAYANICIEREREIYRCARKRNSSSHVLSSSTELMRVRVRPKSWVPARKVAVAHVTLDNFAMAKPLGMLCCRRCKAADSAWRYSWRSSPHAWPEPEIQLREICNKQPPGSAAGKH